jgi:Tol biopolymer transport system component
MTQRAPWFLLVIMITFVVSGGLVGSRVAPALAQPECADSWELLLRRSQIEFDQPTLAHLAMLSDTRAIAVGTRITTLNQQLPLAMHWVDGIWTEQPFPLAGQAFLNTLVAAGGETAWVAGGALTQEGTFVQQPLLFFWNGTAWQRVVTPFDDREGTVFGSLVAADGALWLTGSVVDPGNRRDTPFIIRRQGDTWAIQTLPVTRGSVRGLAFGLNGGWAFGLDYNEAGQELPFLLRWNGTTWTQTPLDGIFAELRFFRTITATPSGAIWLLADTMFGSRLYRWDGASWALAPQFTENPALQQPLAALLAIADDNIWVNPVNAFTPPLHWDGATWRTRPTGGDLSINSLRSFAAALGTGEIFALPQETFEMQVARLRPPTVAFRYPSAGADVGQGTAAIDVSVDPPAPIAVAVAYQTANGSALAGRDYTAAAGTLTIPPCTAAAPVEVPLLDPAGWAPARSFQVRLDQPRGALLGAQRQTSVAITDFAQAPEDRLVFLPNVRQPSPPAPVRPSRLAFVSTRDGNQEIYTIREDGTDLRRLTNDPASDASPSWSPDGSRIVFASDRTTVTQLYVVAAQGGPTTPLISTSFVATNPAWSPDGSQIAFVAATEEAQPRTRMMLVNPDGSGLRELVPPASQFGSVVQLAWSPDGSRIVFSSDRGGTRGQLFQVDVAGGAITPLPPVPTVTFGLSWSPDGKQIAFGTDFGVAILDLASGQVRPANANFDTGVDVSWGPDGRLVYSIGRNIISIDTLQNTLPRAIVRVPGALHTYPVWAPAGTP